jgi:glycerol kinase
MPATLEDLHIVLEAITSCKTKGEIIKNVKLSPEVVNEVLDTLRKMGKISKDQFTETYCPIAAVAADVSNCCNIICDAMKQQEA